MIMRRKITETLRNADPFIFHAGDVRDVGTFRCLPLYMAACL